MFNSCKSPGEKTDQFNFHFRTGSSPTRVHPLTSIAFALRLILLAEEEGSCDDRIVVICRGNLFYFNATDGHGRILSPPELQRHFKSIQDQCMGMHGVK